MSCLSTGIGVGITYGFDGPPYDTTSIPNRLWHVRGNNVVVGGGTTTATDLSGNGHAMVNSGAVGTQPILRTFPGGSAQSLYFDAGDNLTCATSILPVTADAIYTAILVTRYDDTSARIAIDFNTGTGGLALGQGVGGAFEVAWNKGVSFNYGPASSALTATWLMYVFKVAASSTYTAKTYINGVQQVTTVPTSPMSAPVGTGFTLGDYLTAPGNFPMKGDIGEGILVAGDISTLVGTISPYMVSHYGTPS